IAEYTVFQRGCLRGPARAVERVARLGAELLWLVNDARRRAGLSLLKPHEGVTLVAVRHSEEMRDLGYFSHNSPRRERATALQRFMNVFGFQPVLIAENIAMRKSTASVLTLESIRASHQGLMNSAGHRANILMPRVTDFGVGLAVSGENAYWITEVFVRFTF
ncbi:MAG: CAP domain-containing protein, partial [Armatimonadetes bacterium]|nr:CAP domain-containing protein [Armatimonadota bacterium]